MVPCDDTNLLVPVIPPTLAAPALVVKLETLFNEVNCLLPNVGAGRGILLSRTTPVVVLPSAFSAEVAYTNTTVRLIQMDSINNFMICQRYAYGVIRSSQYITGLLPVG